MPQPSTFPVRYRLAIVMTMGLLAGLLVTCSQPLSVYDIVQHSKQLVVLAKPQAGTLATQSSAQRKSLEGLLVERFAKSLSTNGEITVKWLYETDADNLLQRVVRGEAHLGIGQLALTQRRDDQLAFGPSILQLEPQLVYAPAYQAKPDNLLSIEPNQLVLPRGNGYNDALRQLQTDIPSLIWQEQLLTEADLLRAVAYGDVDYTIADAKVVAQMQRYHPNLQVAFDMGFVLPTAWAFPQQNSRILQAKAAVFFQKMGNTNELSKLEDTFYGHLDRHNESDLERFNRLRKERLPQYWPLFAEAGEATNLPTAILAALAYQESFWNPAARSPTGVEGMMMLTLGTAKDLGVTDRTDIEQSIDGGARYLAQLVDHFSQKVNEPDLTWFALAAYNVGSGHVRDAMKLARDNGVDDTRWLNVREYLLKLRDPAWYELTYYGKARGDEAVNYVENIRSYYDLLQVFEPQLATGEPVDAPEMNWYVPLSKVRPVLR